MAIQRIIFCNPPSFDQVTSTSKSDKDKNIGNQKWVVQPLDCNGKPLSNSISWSRTNNNLDYQSIRSHHRDSLKRKRSQNHKSTREQHSSINPTLVSPPSQSYPNHINQNRRSLIEHNRPSKTSKTSEPRPIGFLVAETQDQLEPPININPASTKRDLFQRGSSKDLDGDGGSSSSNQRIRRTNERLKVINIDSDSDSNLNSNSDDDDDQLDSDQVLAQETQLGDLNDSFSLGEVRNENEKDKGTSQDLSREVGRNHQIESESISRAKELESESERRESNLNGNQDGNRGEGRSLSSEIEISSWSKGFAMGLPLSSQSQTQTESHNQDSRSRSRTFGEEEEEERVPDSQEDQDYQEEDTIDVIARMKMDEALRPFQSIPGFERPEVVSSSQGQDQNRDGMNRDRESEIGNANGSRSNLTLAPPTPTPSRDDERSPKSKSNDANETSNPDLLVELEESKKQQLNPNLMKPFKSHSLQTRPPPRLGMVNSRESKRLKVDSISTKEKEKSSESQVDLDSHSSLLISNSKVSILKNGSSSKLQHEDTHDSRQQSFNSNPKVPISEVQDSFSISRSRSDQSFNNLGEGSSMMNENQSHSESMLIKAPKPAFKQPQVKRAQTSNNQKGRLEKELRDKEKKTFIPVGKERMIDDVTKSLERDYTEVEKEERELSYNLSLIRDPNENQSSIMNQPNSIQTFQSETQTQSFLSDTNISIPPPLDFDLKNLTSISNILTNSKKFTDVDSGGLVNVLVLITEISTLQTTFNNESYFGQLKVLDESAPPISLKSWGRIAEDWNGGEDDDHDQDFDEINFRKGNGNGNETQFQYLPTQTPNYNFKSLRIGDVVYLSNLKVRLVPSKPIPHRFISKTRRESNGIKIPNGNEKVVELVASERTGSKAHICWREPKWDGDRFLTFDRAHAKLNPKYKKVLELAKMMEGLK